MSLELAWAITIRPVCEPLKIGTLWLVGDTWAVASTGHFSGHSGEGGVCISLGLSSLGLCLK